MNEQGRLLTVNGILVLEVQQVELGHLVKSRLDQNSPFLAAYVETQGGAFLIHGRIEQTGSHRQCIMGIFEILSSNDLVEVGDAQGNPREWQIVVGVPFVWDKGSKFISSPTRLLLFPSEYTQSRWLEVGYPTSDGRTAHNLAQIKSLMNHGD